MNKLVSVIIPAYNVEKYIGQTLNSVIKQTYTNLEILVVNGKSTDQTADIVEMYAKRDSRIISFFQERTGLSEARNAGLKRATGEYFCIFDADDIMLPDKIHTQVKFLEDNHKCDFTYSNLYYFVDGKENIYSYFMPTPSSQMYENLLSYGNFINPNTVFFRREIYNRLGGFDESLQGTEDFDYWLKLAHANVVFLFQDKHLTLYRIRKNSLSSHSIKYYESGVKVIKKYQQIEKNEVFSSIIVRKLQKAEIRLGITYLRKGRYPDARAIAMKNSKFKSIYTLARFFPPFIINLTWIILKRLKFPIKFKETRNTKIENFLMSITQS